MVGFLVTLTAFALGAAVFLVRCKIPGVAAALVGAPRPKARLAIDLGETWFLALIALSPFTFLLPGDLDATIAMGVVAAAFAFLTLGFAIGLASRGPDFILGRLPLIGRSLREDLNPFAFAANFSVALGLIVAFGGGLWLGLGTTEGDALFFGTLLAGLTVAILAPIDFELARQFVAGRELDTSPVAPATPAE